MSNARPRYTTPRLDWPTLGLLLVMVAGFPAITWGYHVGYLPAWATVLIGSVLMNLSFTAWHEPSHHNVSRLRLVNDLVGLIASVASVYPGYYARRREHLMHHRWQGVPDMDPVYARIQTSFWGLPLAVVTVNYGAQKRELKVPDTFQPMHAWMRLADTLSLGLVLGILILSVVQRFWVALLLAWIVPRVIIFVAHAYYICYFPHRSATDGYQVYRIRRLGPVARFLTVEQTYHGLHHKWPYLPWHRYRAISTTWAASLAEQGVEILPG